MAMLMSPRCGSGSPCEHGSYKRQAFSDFRESLMPPFAVGASVIRSAHPFGAALRAFLRCARWRRDPRPGSKAFSPQKA